MSPTTRTDDDSFCTFYNVLHDKYIYSNNNLSMLFQLLALTALLLPCLGDPCQTHIAELTALAILDKPKCLRFTIQSFKKFTGTSSTLAK